MDNSFLGFLGLRSHNKTNVYIALRLVPFGNKGGKVARDPRTIVVIFSIESFVLNLFVCVIEDDLASFLFQVNAIPEVPDKCAFFCSSSNGLKIAVVFYGF